MSEPLRQVARRRTWSRKSLVRATRHYGKLEFEFCQKGPKCAGYTYYWLAAKLVPSGTEGALSISPLQGVVSSQDSRRKEESFQKVQGIAEKLQEDVHDKEKHKRNMYYLSSDMHRALTLSDNALQFFGERGITVRMLYHGDVSQTSGAKREIKTGPPPDFNKEIIGWLIANHNDWRCGILSLRYEKGKEGEHGHAVGIYNGIGDKADLWQKIYFFDPNLGEFSFSCQASFWEWLFRAYLPYFFDPGREEPRTYKYFKFAQLVHTPVPRLTATSSTTTTTTTTTRSSTTTTTTTSYGSL